MTLKLKPGIQKEIADAYHWWSQMDGYDQMKFLDSAILQEKNHKTFLIGIKSIWKRRSLTKKECLCLSKINRNNEN